jgi:hypothetical protein
LRGIALDLLAISERGELVLKLLYVCAGHRPLARGQSVMRSTLLFSTLLAFACSFACSDASDTLDNPTPDDAGSGGTAGSDETGAGTGGNGKGGSGATKPPRNEGEPPGEVGAEQQLVEGSVTLVGITSDGWALFRDPSGLSAVEVAGEGEIELVSEQPGNVLIKGPVAFNWADMDWSVNRGDLSIWSHARGAEEVGSTLYSEVLVAASADGDAIVYTANTEDGSTDLVVAYDDSTETLIEGMGLAAEETCAPSVGFVGDRLFAGWCEVGERYGRIDRFERDGDDWEKTTIAEDTLPSWSADAEGERVFFQANTYEGFYAEGGERYRIDASVSRGFMAPDGSAVLYTVGDQLRRAALPDPEPVPLVTVGFSAPVAFPQNFSYALYSSKVTYEKGTQRDLRLVPTDGYTPEPIVLVSEPVATLPRSYLTNDGRFIFYLTDIGTQGGNLHVVDLEGNEVLFLENVVEAVAARDDSIVYTSNPSDPEVYPVVAQLNVVDVDWGEPQLIEEGVADARNFRLDAALERVIYVRSGVGRDPADPASQGLFWRDLP